MADRGKEARVLYGRDGMDLVVPKHASVLAGAGFAPLPDPGAALREALARPLGVPPLATLVQARRPQRVAITISDVTRPVPSRQLLLPLLEELARAGISSAQVVVIVGTGMHRPSTEAELESMIGRDILARVEVVDHRADQPATLVEISQHPLVRVNRRFAEADLRIVTGYIEPHFMAGFSGGRKGICPALVDLATIERFHGFAVLAHPQARSGVLQDNPCHEIALAVARRVGVDLLLNVALSPDRRIAGVYCGELEQAHFAGCREVAAATSARLDGPYDLVITSGGGYPLDQTFYQTVKGMVEALPALHSQSVLLQVSQCREGLGSTAYGELLRRWAENWQGFLAYLEAHRAQTLLDQWELQMQCRVLARIGRERLWFASDGIPQDLQQRIGVQPLLGGGDARARAQQAIDRLLAEQPRARVAVVPDGPYTMLVS